MKKLTTYEELVAHKGEKVTFYIQDKFIDDAWIDVEEETVFICENLNDNSIKSWIVGVEGAMYQNFKDITLVEEEEEQIQEAPEELITIQLTASEVEKLKTLLKIVGI